MTGFPLRLLDWTMHLQQLCSQMSTVLEIERAIEQLPTAQLLEVAEWLDEQRATLAASASVC